MNRLGIFVEGETEQLFVEKLTRELAGSRRLYIELTRARGGVSTRRRTAFVKDGDKLVGIDYYVLIVDCGGDGGVKSRLVEDYQNLVRKGYQALIALRDVPRDRAKLARFQAEWPRGIPTDPIAVVCVLAIMEIEAWFLAEHTHFRHINEKLTAELVLERLGFDTTGPNMRGRDRPAQDLDNAYQLVDERYQKGRAAQRTIHCLDFERLVCELAPEEPELQRLIDAIDAFLHLPT
jgi:hypothetical protein